jgi:hypothetical protein
MRLYTGQHRFYVGVDLHAKSLSDSLDACGRVERVGPRRGRQAEYAETLWILVEAGPIPLTVAIAIV